MVEQRLTEVVTGADKILTEMAASHTIFGVYNYRLSETFNGTAVFPVLKKLPNRHAYSYRVHTSSSLRTWRNVVFQRSFLKGLKVFDNVLFGDKQTASSGNWKPYTRLSQYGSVLPNGYRAFRKLKDYPFLDGPWSASVVDDWRISFHHDNIRNVDFFDADDIWYFFQGVFDAHGSAVSFMRQYSSNRTTTDLKDLYVGDDRITYHMSVETNAPPSSTTSFFYEIGVEIVRCVEDSNQVYFRVTGQNSVKRVTTSGTDYATVSKQSHYNPHIEVEQRDGYERTLRLSLSANQSISSARPGLYHTQASSFTRALGDMSRNFETLMETPGTIELIKSVMTAAVLGVNAPSRFLQRARWLVKGILSGRLIYLFAVEPALKSWADVATSVVRDLSVKFESTIEYKSTTHPFSSLPDSLKEYILSDLSILEADLASYRITFHSELQLYDVEKLVSDVVGRSAEHFHTLGLIPEPRYIWAGLPLSFVVDWFIPISRLIQDAQSTLLSVKLDVGTIGHSVFIELVDKTGATTAIYLRSSNSVEPLDPSSESWLLSGGVYTAAAIPLVLLNTVFR